MQASCYNRQPLEITVAGPITDSMPFQWCKMKGYATAVVTQQTISKHGSSISISISRSDSSSSSSNISSSNSSSNFL